MLAGEIAEHYLASETRDEADRWLRGLAALHKNEEIR